MTLHCQDTTQYAKEQDSEEVRHWLEITYPAIARPPVRIRRSTSTTRKARRLTSNRDVIKKEKED